MQYDPDTYTHIEIAWEFLWTLSKLLLYGVFALRYYMLSTATIYTKTSVCAKYIIFSTIVIALCVQALLQSIYIVLFFYYADSVFGAYSEAQIRRTYLDI